MSIEATLRKNAKEIHQRLMYPPNPVPDTGIDLKKPPEGTRAPQEKPDFRPRAIVSVIEKYINHQPSIVAPEVLEYHHLPPLTFNNILHLVAKHYSVSISDILSPIRKHHLVWARRIIAYLALKLLKYRSKSSIARQLRKDHSSIIHGQKEILKTLPNDLILFNVLVSLEEKLRADYLV